MCPGDSGGQQEGEDMDPLSDGYSSDDQLNPVEKLEKYFQSDDPSERFVTNLHLSLFSLSHV